MRYGKPFIPSPRKYQFIAKLESDVVRPYNPPFYDRYVDDRFSKRKKGKPDDLLERLNSYHPNIVFTVEGNPDHFLDIAFTYDDKFNCRVYKKPGNYQPTGNQKSPPNGKEIVLLVPSTELSASLPILIAKSKHWKQPF